MANNRPHTNYRDVLNTVMGYLYHQKKEGNPGYFDLLIILKAIGYPSSINETIEAAKYLQAKDYVKALFQFDEIYLQITTQGVIYVEDLFNQNRLNEDQVKDIAKKIKQKAKSEMQIERPNIRNIHEKRKSLQDILKKLKKDLGSTATPNNYDDSIDLDIVSLELKKYNPDKEVIRQKLLKLDILNSKTNLLKLFNALNI